MCGIVGFTHNDHAGTGDRIQRATRALVHRGPDQQGVYETDRVSLGAVRLKIIDLEHGNQPIIERTASGEVVIVYNGEIYNHAELRSELESLGHRFNSRCDTEVILRAFLQWDLEAFAHLHGMFAVALWDEQRRRLLLARDRIGIKPLYFSRRGCDIYFASELKGILVHPEIDREIDLDGLNYYLSLNYVPTPHTLITSIEKLRPGCWLEWRDGNVRTEPYWKLPLETPQRCSLQDAKHRLDTLLQDSVREHLISDVPLGIWASGGIDSSTILHYASKATPARLKTFSVAFPGRSFDESPWFRRVAEVYGTDHHEVVVDPQLDLRDAVEELSYYSDEPSADAGALPVWFLAKMSRQHVTVALSGEGGDELFGGYNTYLADRYARALRRWPRGMRSLGASLLEHWPASDEKISLGYKLKRFFNGSLLSPDVAHLYWNGTFSERQKRDFYLAGNGSRLEDLFTCVNGAEIGYLNRFLAFDQLNYLPDDILYKCDRMSMAHSLEVRVPFLDHRIIEFTASLPEHIKIRGSTLKFVLRELMKDKLPPEVLSHRKEGLDIPAHEWM
ncbi:MAG: asparagine synthase (glutamine-hydrolyzing), partial [Candidatus Eremiobacteraeota bacterium]|nr:asparagine synthase (glutamine-hydrolyzing) [Candidatus Eremiobacteraeota bacterium]